MNKYWLWACVFFKLFSLLKCDAEDPNPFNQQLPDCKLPFKKIEKKNDVKAIVCPMFR